jgi:predicted acetyltransferase
MYNITYRFAEEKDIDIYISWANDSMVRKNSFSPDAISFDTHQVWFLNKLKSNKTFLFIFFVGDKAVGQVRLDFNDNDELEIDYSVDISWRGKKIAPQLLSLTVKCVRKFYPDKVIIGIVDEKNIASVKSFQSSGFFLKEQLIVKGKICNRYIL